jgi:putative regulator of septum formation
MRRLAVAALTLAALGGCAKHEANAASDTPTTRTVAGGEHIVGECIVRDRPPSKGISSVPCSKPHNAEVTAAIDLLGRFPGRTPTAAELEAIATNSPECATAAEAYLGTPRDPRLSDSGEVIFPRPESWLADSRMYCLAVTTDYQNIAGSWKRA